MSWIREGREEAGREEGAGLDDIRGRGSEINVFSVPVKIFTVYDSEQSKQMGEEQTAIVAGDDEIQKLARKLDNMFSHAFNISVATPS